MKLYQHQQEVVDANKPRLLIAFGTGCGKTLTAMSLGKKNNLWQLLIICPKSLKRNWQEQVPDSWRVMTKEEFRRDWSKLGDYVGVIVDEAHFFCNLKSQMSKALLKYCKKWNIKYRWLLTATPLTKDAMSIYGLVLH